MRRTMAAVAAALLGTVAMADGAELKKARPK